MFAKKLVKSFIRPMSIVLVFGLAACVYDPVYTGPPPHAPPPYFHPYDYYYYPSVRVYFHVSSGYYYYPSGKRWIRVKDLPPHFRLNHRERFHIRMKSDKPYEKHDKHRKKYIPLRKYDLDPQIDRKEREHHKKWHELYQNKQEKYGNKRKDEERKLRD